MERFLSFSLIFFFTVLRCGSKGRPRLLFSPFEVFRSPLDATLYLDSISSSSSSSHKKKVSIYFNLFPISKGGTRMSFPSFLLIKKRANYRHTQVCMCPCTTDHCPPPGIWRGCPHMRATVRIKFIRSIRSNFNGFFFLVFFFRNIKNIFHPFLHRLKDNSNSWWWRP